MLPARPYRGEVRVYDMIVAERLRMADVLEGLTGEQMRSPSLCSGWTVHDVAAHLISYLRFCQLKIYGGILVTAADFDRLNVLLTRYEARRPSGEIIDVLRRHAGSRITIPRSGYDPVLSDIMLHDLDIRYPLGMARNDDRQQQLWVACRHLATQPSPGFGIDSRLAGLRFKATDAGWVLGNGPAVRGTAEMLMLGMGGRDAAFAQLEGEGVPVLRQRVDAQAKPSPIRRLARPLRVLLSPPPPARRSRGALPDPGWSSAARAR
jgi:uncharacterized protein (TIGR03083 family)